MAQESTSQSVNLQNLIKPQLIGKTVAAQIARLILLDRWGQLRTDQQGDLVVQDNGDYWKVVGSGNIDGDYGQFCAIINKRNGEIHDIGIYHGAGGLPGY